MKEYIVPIEDSEKDFDGMFVGYIRNCSAEVVRCKNCKHKPFEKQVHVDSLTESSTITVIDGDPACPCIDENDSHNSWMPPDYWYCANGQRKEDKK